jgi:hypothetical protein
MVMTVVQAIVEMQQAISRGWCQIQQGYEFMYDLFQSSWCAPNDMHVM